jgi:hypothetical protein
MVKVFPKIMQKDVLGMNRQQLKGGDDGAQFYLSHLYENEFMDRLILVLNLFIINK